MSLSATNNKNLRKYLRGQLEAEKVIIGERKQSTTDKEQINKELVSSGGILRDYDNDEILYPLNFDVLRMVKTMIDVRRKNL